VVLHQFEEVPPEHLEDDPGESEVEAKRLLLTEHPDYKRLEAEAKEARLKATVRLEELRASFDKAHPETNLMTGKI
jgi:hypothetical protein